MQVTLHYHYNMYVKIYRLSNIIINSSKEKLNYLNFVNFNDYDIKKSRFYKELFEIFLLFSIFIINFYYTK